MLLSVANVKKGFGTDVILDGVTFRLERREKVALVGRNGTGKTTLLRILNREQEPDAGHVHIPRGVKIGYLKQEAPVDSTRTVLEEAEEARRHALELKRRLEELEARIEKESTPEDLEEYAALHEHFMEAEGYAADRDVRTILLRMGFTEDELQKPASKLSGGETTRLALARLILEEPDLLILDEPTNHLDLQATEWLEGWLRGYPGAVLVVSHDRTFLENFGQRFLEMREGKVFSYPGPFEKFLKLRAEEDARLVEVVKRQQQQIDKMDEFVRRFMNSERTAQARGRLKLLNRLIANRASAPTHDKTMSASLKATARTGDIVVETKKLTVGFPADPAPLTLIRGLDWTVRRGERWGIIGENGAGKSSLIRVLLGRLKALDGASRLGSNVEAGYFSQDAGEFDPSDTPLDVVVDTTGLKPPEARDLLGRYLFSGDDVFRPVKTFSGGEKNKLALAVLTALNPNLLVLDEPTNHLDMASREALANVLEQYNGTLLLISHDRWLLSKVTNRTLDIRRDGVRQFPGSYAEYRRRSTSPSASSNTPVAKAAPTASTAAATMTPRELSKEIQRVGKLVESLEAEVSEAEAELRQVEDALANLPPNADIFELTKRHAFLQEEVAGKLSAWEEQSERLVELEGLKGG